MAQHAPGDLIADRYRIEQVLGEGGSGIAYGARDRDGSFIAIKCLSLRAAGSWKAIELFEREARVLALLEHPAIPRYLDYFYLDSDRDRAFYLVREFVAGQSLETAIRNGWKPNERTVKRRLREVLEVLAYLHGRQPPTVHRDIKPANLIEAPDGTLRLIDFGAVHDAYCKTLVGTQTFVGTLGYMPPEQFRGHSTPQVDLYALGATAIYLLTGRSPDALPVRDLKMQFRDRLSISPPFADWIERLIEPDPRDRWPSAEAAIAALDALDRPAIVAAPPRSPLGPSPLAPLGLLSDRCLTYYRSDTQLTLVLEGEHLLPRLILRPRRSKRSKKALFDPPPLLARHTAVELAVNLLSVATLWILFLLCVSLAGLAMQIGWPLPLFAAIALFKGAQILLQDIIPRWGNQLLRRIYRHYRLTIAIAPDQFTLTEQCFFWSPKPRRGNTADLIAVRYLEADPSSWRSSSSHLPPRSLLMLCEGVHEHRVGVFLDVPTQRFAQKEIKGFLKSLGQYIYE
jgi:serine/threonine protein kinase